MVFHRFFFFGLFLFGASGTVQDGQAPSNNSCLDSAVSDTLSPDQLVAKLTDPSCYDKYQRPDFSNNNNPFNVGVRIHLTHVEIAQSQLTVYLLMLFDYTDDRLKYEKISNQTIVMGEESLKNVIWTPNVVFKDQSQTIVKDFQEKNVFVSIKPEGEVTYSYKMIVTFYCSLNLRKFPFDSQNCSLTLGDWFHSNHSLLWTSSNTTNASDDSQQLRFSEFVLDKFMFNSITEEGPYGADSSLGFSELNITLTFHRDIGYYLFDFFLPSYLLVCTAWVTFWLQADAGPPRATLGASTVIAFVTLHLGVAKDIPKVSYIKASDIWFLAISCFIFFSLAEFAFVNVIWRRKKQVELKKRSNKHILKGAVMPSVARKDLRKLESTPNLWTPSSESLNQTNGHAFPHSDDRFNGNYRSNVDLVSNEMQTGHSTISIPEEAAQQSSWETMTPREVAIWVDRKARIVFPLVFLIFNILYWTFVLVEL